MFIMLAGSYPEEAEIVGRILGGYPELEFAMLICVYEAREDFDAVFKSLFGVRGETRRVQKAEALGRPNYQKLGLGTEFEMAIGAMRHFLRIRNQYAHAHWLANPTGLGVVDLEEPLDQGAKVDGSSQFKFHETNLEILKTQEKFGVNVREMFHWLEVEAMSRRGKLPKNQVPKPKQVAQPLLYKR